MKKNALISLLLLAGISMGCATDSPEGPVEPGYRPALQSTEAGLWMTMDKFERRLANSELVERDPELNRYVRGVLCRVSPSHCEDVRVFIIKNPYFNATMAPNGSMHVWSGLLLRVQNEDQLAAVLAHEMAHYLHRHSLKQWNTTKATLEFLTFFSIATGGFDGGLTGLAVSLGAQGALQSYSQEFEHEADQVGLELIAEAGYNTEQVVAMWELVKAEKEADPESEKRNVFWRSHPPTQERIKRLKDQSAALQKTQVRQLPMEGRQFEDVYNRHWHKWAENLVAITSPDEAQVVLKRLQLGGRDEHEVAFFMGESFRRHGTEEDLAKARENYLKAAQMKPAPLKTYKHLALVERRLGHNSLALQYFETYLEQNPDASDEKLVRVYMKQLGN